MTTSEAPRALYQQVKDHVISRIASGRWPPDTRIPSENQLVNALKVSRMTANRALRELATEGHLVRVKGVGTYVAKPKALAPLLEIRSIDDEILDWGGRHTCTVHLQAEEKARPEVARRMRMGAGARVFHSIIVHRDRGVPVLLADRYVHPGYFPDFLDQDFTVLTPTTYLLNRLRPTDIEHTIEALLPDRTSRTLLEMSEQEPCLVLYRRTWAGAAVTTQSRFTYPGKRYRIGGRFKNPPSAAVKPQSQPTPIAK
jgi:GntR family histidine utilization transcriptional repressor